MTNQHTSVVHISHQHFEPMGVLEVSLKRQTRNVNGRRNTHSHRFGGLGASQRKDTPDKIVGTERGPDS